MGVWRAGGEEGGGEGGGEEQHYIYINLLLCTGALLIHLDEKGGVTNH